VVGHRSVSLAKEEGRQAGGKNGGREQGIFGWRERNMGM